MPLIDLENKIIEKTSDPTKQAELRDMAVLGLMAAIEEVERLKSQAVNGQYFASYIAALEESLTYLNAIKRRTEAGAATHPSTKV